MALSSHVFSRLLSFSPLSLEVLQRPKLLLHLLLSCRWYVSCQTTNGAMLRLLVVSMMKEWCCHQLEAAIVLVQVHPIGIQCWPGQTRQCDQIIRTRKKNLKFAMLCLKLGSVASSIF
jgi:hypothetical protein